MAYVFVRGDAFDEFAGLAMDGAEPAFDPRQGDRGRLGRPIRPVRQIRPSPQVRGISLEFPSQLRQFPREPVHGFLLVHAP
jgi:hypothetical protein